MKIVLGVDASPHSEAALEFVRRMAWPAGTEVVVVSAVTLPGSVLGATMAPVTGMETGVWDKTLTELSTEWVSGAERTLRDAGLTVRGQVVHGDPRECLIEVATQEGADMLVVGSHGRSGLSKLLLGSVASHLVAHAPCHVLVVRLGSKNP